MDEDVPMEVPAAVVSLLVIRAGVLMLAVLITPPPATPTSRRSVKTAIQPADWIFRQ